MDLQHARQWQAQRGQAPARLQRRGAGSSTDALLPDDTGGAAAFRPPGIRAQVPSVDVASMIRTAWDFAKRCAAALRRVNRVLALGAGASALLTVSAIYSHRAHNEKIVSE